MNISSKQSAALPEQLVELGGTETIGALDQADTAFRSDDISDLGRVRSRGHEGGDDIDDGMPSAVSCGASGWRWSTTWWAPMLRTHCVGCGARGGGDHREAGQGPRELNGNRADTPCAADDKQRVGVGPRFLADADAIEQQLPSGEPGQGQCRGLSEVQCRRFGPTIRSSTR